MRNRFTREPEIKNMVTENIGTTAIKTLCVSCGVEDLAIICSPTDGLDLNAQEASEKVNRVFMKHVCKMRAEMVSSGL